ncbi:MAG: hypothetical protein V4490_07785 [Pseudomonadota bacterium]
MERPHPATADLLSDEARSSNRPEMSDDIKSLQDLIKVEIDRLLSLTEVLNATWRKLLQIDEVLCECHAIAIGQPYNPNRATTDYVRTYPMVERFNISSSSVEALQQTLKEVSESITATNSELATRQNILRMKHVEWHVFKAALNVPLSSIPGANAITEDEISPTVQELETLLSRKQSELQNLNKILKDLCEQIDYKKTFIEDYKKQIQQLVELVDQETKPSPMEVSPVTQELTTLRVPHAVNISQLQGAAYTFAYVLNQVGKILFLTDSVYPCIEQKREELSLLDTEFAKLEARIAALTCTSEQHAIRNAPPSAFAPEDVSRPQPAVTFSGQQTSEKSVAGSLVKSSTEEPAGPKPPVLH